MRMIKADDLEQALREAGLTEAIKDCNKYTSAWGVPIIDAKPMKHGHWIFNPYNSKDAIEMIFTRPKCSVCGAESAEGGNYCSNCGAAMEW